jgi:hypothetical protein
MQSAIEGLRAMVRGRRYSTLWEAAAEFIEFGRERHHTVKPPTDSWVQAGKSLFRTEKEDLSDDDSNGNWLREFFTRPEIVQEFISFRNRRGGQKCAM